MPLIFNLQAACAATGFVPRHAEACQSVAQRLNCVILFREPGLAAGPLIADDYSMKGFRIDTKSCNWGPMTGFVCADPRLSKHKDKAAKTSYAARNADWTEEALHGSVNLTYFEQPAAEEQAAWKAGVMPLVISRARVDELIKDGKIKVSRTDGKDLIGTSSADFSGDQKVGIVNLPWRLKPTLGATNSWLKGPGGANYEGEYYAVCVEPKMGFQQILPHGVKPLLFRGYETLLGLINPGTAERGFKACVTADYDLFSIWPSKSDAMGGMHNVVSQLNRGPAAATPAAATHLPQGVRRMGGVDDRLSVQKTAERKNVEHFRFGDVSARVMHVKTLLNGAIQGPGGYKGGNTIHHNDEAGNVVLAKDNLTECLPLIGFMPDVQTGRYAQHGVRSAANIRNMPGGAFLISSLADFKALYEQAAPFFNPIVKREWLISAGCRV